jgi:hypothetical protein
MISTGQTKPNRPDQPPARRVFHDMGGSGLLFFTPLIIYSITGAVEESQLAAAAAGGEASSHGWMEGGASPAQVALLSAVPYLVTSIAHREFFLGCLIVIVLLPLRPFPAQASLMPKTSRPLAVSDQRVAFAAHRRAAASPRPLLGARRCGSAGAALCHAPGRHSWRSVLPADRRTRELAV